MELRIMKVLLLFGIFAFSFVGFLPLCNVKVCLCACAIVCVCLCVFICASMFVCLCVFAPWVLCVRVFNFVRVCNPSYSAPSHPFSPSTYHHTGRV